VIDIDGDGDERTGWTVLYLHIAAQDRVAEGAEVQPSTPIGHPSCEGFYLSASATHLHVARRYNGEWVPADCWACPPGVAAPSFMMSGWLVRGQSNRIFRGWLEKDGQVRRAASGPYATEHDVSW
jgi:LasA protease